MDRTEILCELKKIFASVKDVDIKELDFVDENTSIKDDLGLNSIGVLYIVVAIERQFDIDMQSVEAEKFVTVGDVVDFLSEEI